MTTRKKPGHGTVNRYTNYLCRCDKCRAAASAYQKQRREIRAAS